MIDDTPKSAAPIPSAPSAEGGERIAKVMARAGVASRRDAEKMILASRVTVNGKIVTSPALDVAPGDRVALDGKPIDEKQPTRLWLYYKPLGLVVSEKDEKGRQTVFDTMPEGMPRVMSVGRLDLNSEGLLLLTNDGELKRRLEMPSTGWLRKYRVRVNGQPTDATFEPLRRGITIEGEDFQPMEVSLDRQQGANAWATVGIREGKNREVRRAMTEVGLYVNRLIRVSYGPFRLNEMKPGDVIEIRARVMRDQLGALLTGEEEQAAPARKPRSAGFRSHEGRAGGGAGGDRPRSAGFRSHGAPGDRPRRAEGEAEERPRKPRFGKPGFDEGARKPRSGSFRRDGEEGGERPARAPRGPRSEGSWGDRSGSAKTGGDRPRSGGFRSHGAEGGPARGYRGEAAGDGDRKPRSGGFRSHGDGERPARGPRGEGEGGGKPRSGGFRSHAAGRAEGGPRKPRSGPGRAQGAEGGERSFAPRSRPAEGGAGSRGPRGEGGKPGGKPWGAGGKPRFEGSRDGSRSEGGRSGGGRSEGGRSEGGPKPFRSRSPDGKQSGGPRGAGKGGGRPGGGAGPKGPRSPR